MEIGDKLLQVMKEKQMDIKELAEKFKISEYTILEILAGLREADLSSLCSMAEGLGIGVQELQEDEDTYFIPVQKGILAKLIAISELENVEIELLIHNMLDSGIVEYCF